MDRYPGPSDEEITYHFINDGQLDVALGQWVRAMLDAGILVTLVDYEAVAWAETLESKQYRDWTIDTMRSWVRLTVWFRSDPETISVSSPIAILAQLIIAIGVMILFILFGVGAFFALQNLTTKEEKYAKYAWVYNPNTGQNEWKVVEEGYSKGPPEWWGTVFTVVGVSAVIVVAAVVLPQVIGAIRPSKPSRPEIVYAAPPPPQV